MSESVFIPSWPTKHDVMMQTFRPLSEFRWLRPSGTTTKPDRLQQAYQCMGDGHTEWRDVPVHVEVVPPAPQKQGRG